MSKVSWEANLDMADTDFAAAGTAKTMMAAIPASGKLVVVRAVTVSFAESNPTDKAVKLEVLRKSTTATGTGTDMTSSLTRRKGPAATFGGTVKKLYSAEPTTLTLMQTFYVDPAKGLYLMENALGDELESDVGGSNDGGSLCFRFTYVTGQTRRAAAMTLRLEEG